jgi:chemotaxis signal transduction protein
LNAGKLSKKQMQSELKGVDRNRTMLPRQGLSTNDLERMADEEFWNYARVRADTVPWISSEESNYQDQHLECELSDGNCLIPLKAIVEVLPSYQQYMYLPLTPPWMCGLFAWRGQTIPLIDLDMYLSGVSSSRPGGMIVIANYCDITVGLLVPGVGLTTTIQFEQLNPSSGPTVFYTPIRAGVIRGVYAEEPVLDVSALLPDVVQQIGMAAYYG